MKKQYRISLIAALVVIMAVTVALAGSRGSAWLGVYTQEVDRDLAGAFDLPVHYGAIINEIIEDSPAEKAGLQEDDIIVALDGSRVGDADDLIDLISDADPGDQTTLKIWRDGKEIEIQLELGKRPRSMRGRDNDFFFYSPSAPHAPHAPTAPRAPSAPSAPHSYTYSFNDGDFEQTYLGVRMIALSRPAAQALGAEKYAVLIDEVDEDSPAETAGLKPGDLIVAIAGELTSKPDDVQDIIRDMAAGDKVTIDYIRNGQKGTVEVELAEGEVDSFYGGNNILRLPDLPDFDLDLPSMRGLHFGHSDLRDSYHDADEYQDDMKDLQKELKQLQEELTDLRKSLE